MSPSDLGQRVATVRSLTGMTQRQLAVRANVSYGMVRAVERGARTPSEKVLDALADALGVDPTRLLTGGAGGALRVREAIPAISAVLASYDQPDDGPIRPISDLHSAVAKVVGWRLASQYARVAQSVPPLLEELSRALCTAGADQRPQLARLLTAAYRAADSVAYKVGALDLSARLVELMRWAAVRADDALLEAVVAYVRTETFFVARAHMPGLRALESALDNAPPAIGALAMACRGALHMRAAVIAGRAGATEAAVMHLDEARAFGDRMPEGIYLGTAFGPSSVRMHEVSVAVSLGGDHLRKVVTTAQEWVPPQSMPAERRSGFYIELARARLWAGLRDEAFEALQTARRIAPQHVREHSWVREDIAILRRIKRAHHEDLSNYVEWCHAV